MLMQLKPVDYIRKNNDAKTRGMSFIAQDIEELLTKIDYQDQGFLTKDDDGNFNLRYSDIIALNTKALQEQQEVITGLESVVLELQNQINELNKVVAKE